MQLNDYLEQVSEQLRSSAALGDERTREIAAALAGTAQASVRLAVIGAVSAAADEITAALFEAGAQGSPVVAMHLDGDDLALRVTLTPDEPPEPPPTDDGEATARISLRLTEALKADVEQAAERESVSVNTWLVRAARAALSPRGSGWGDWGPGWSGWAGWPGWPGRPAHAGGQGGHGQGGHGGPGGGHGPHRTTGWVKG